MTPQDMSEEELRAWIGQLSADARRKVELEEDLEEPLPPMEFDESAGFLCEFPDCGEEIDEPPMCAKHTEMLAKFDEERKQC